MSRMTSLLQGAVIAFSPSGAVMKAVPWKYPAPLEQLYDALIGEASTRGLPNIVSHAARNATRPERAAAAAGGSFRRCGRDRRR